jgi:hypothetical protein
MTATAPLRRLSTLLACAFAVTLAPAAALGIQEVGPAVAALEAAEAAASGSRFREAPKAGPNVWLDFVSMRNGRIVRVFSDDVPGGRALEVSRFANVLAVGFEWSNDLLSLEVSNALMDAGRVDTPEPGAPVESFGFFTSPAARLAIRPIEMLRLDLDATYNWGKEADALLHSETTPKGSTGWEHHLLTGGLLVVFEPVSNFYGTHAQFEIAAGVRVAWAKATHDAHDGMPARDISGTSLLFGGRISSVIPFGEQVAFFTGLGAWFGLDPSHAGDIGGASEHFNVDWSIGLRWFPLGG